MTPPLTYSFDIGAIRCTVLADGSATVSFERLQQRFPTVSESDLRRALEFVGENPDQMSTYYNPLLIQVNGETILVDSGERPERHPTAGQTQACLDSIGIQPADIDKIIITHAHGDHIIGLFEPETDALIYPNAAVYISSQEWAHWTDPDRLTAMGEYGNQLRIWFNALAPVIQLVQDGVPILDGITPILTPGHTPGHLCLLVESKDQVLLHGVDLVHSLIQFPHPEYSIKFDTDGELAIASRMAVFNRIAEMGWLTLFYHLPFPGLGTVSKSDDGYIWQPIGPK